MYINNKKATSIVEAMIILLIVVTWVTWMYNIYIKSLNLSESTTNKIQAIQIANQWIEAYTNIRDTNWMLFSSNYKNCWNTLNYNTSCISDWTSAWKIIDWSYKIYKESDNRWQLLRYTGTETQYSQTAYRNFYRVWLDSIWVYTQTWVTNNLNPIFTREIDVEYLDSGTYQSPRVKITSIIQRTDGNTTTPHRVEISQILTNWKDY